eukprot:3664473-Rhodomonas_salina.1
MGNGSKSGKQNQFPSPAIQSEQPHAALAHPARTLFLECRLTLDLGQLLGCGQGQIQGAGCYTAYARPSFQPRVQNAPRYVLQTSVATIGIIFHPRCADNLV